MLEAVKYPPVNADDVTSVTLGDPWLSRVKNWVRDSWPEQGVSPEYAAYQTSLTLTSSFRQRPAPVTRSPVREIAMPADDGPTSTVPDNAQACRRSAHARRPVLRYGIDC
ncbi:hypothetical protein MRX96_004654 [Rhipicephalus microplus]